MKRLTAVLLSILGLALTGCAGVKGSGASPGKVCAVHQVPLQKKKVPISYGMPMWSDYDTKMTQEATRSFPHSAVQAEGGCVVMKDAPKQIEVWQCPNCLLAKSEWVKQHPRPNHEMH